MKIIDDDELLARHLADIAAGVLKDLFTNSSLSGQALGDFADKKANEAIIEALRLQRPNDAILSEESIDDKSRLSINRVWIIDPLDGTLEYKVRRDDWAVHIGLAINGFAAIGAVAIPRHGHIYSTQKLGATKGAVAAGSRSKEPIMLLSRSRGPECAKSLALRLGAQVKHMGSAGYKAMQIVSGNADIYFHTGGQSEWDNCAPIAVAKAYGLYAGDIYGNEIVYNKADVTVENLLICKPEFAAKIIEWTKNNLL